MPKEMKVYKCRAESGYSTGRGSLPGFSGKYQKPVNYDAGIFNSCPQTLGKFNKENRLDGGEKIIKISLRRQRPEGGKAMLSRPGGPR